jgi:hypothetical protein
MCCHEFVSIQVKCQPWRKSCRKGEGYEKLSTRQCKVNIDEVPLTQEEGESSDDEEDQDRLFTKT